MNSPVRCMALSNCRSVLEVPGCYRKKNKPSGAAAGEKNKGKRLVRREQLALAEFLEQRSGNQGTGVDGLGHRGQQKEGMSNVDGLAVRSSLDKLRVRCRERLLVRGLQWKVGQMKSWLEQRYTERNKRRIAGRILLMRVLVGAGPVCVQRWRAGRRIVDSTQNNRVRQWMKQARWFLVVVDIQGLRPTYG